MEEGVLLNSNQDNHNVGKFSMCIVWSPIPFLTWLVPFIGHVGIGTTAGEINDFAGSYYIHKSMNETCFGSVSKYYRVSQRDILKENYDPDLPFQSADEIWDESINEANNEFENRTHNLLCNNCHSHVAMALNRMKFRGSKRWNTFLIIVYMIFFSKFNGYECLLKMGIKILHANLNFRFKGFLNAYGGFLVILSIILMIILIIKVT